MNQSEITNEAIRALIASNEAVSASVILSSKTVEATNETVKELTKSVQELVSTERERVLKDEYQKDINKKQAVYNKENDAKWDGARDTIAMSARIQSVAGGVFAKVIAVLIISILVLLGFDF